MAAATTSRNSQRSHPRRGLDMRKIPNEKSPPGTTGGLLQFTTSTRGSQQLRQRLRLVAGDGERAAEVVADAGVRLRGRVDAQTAVDRREDVADVRRHVLRSFASGVGRAVDLPTLDGPAADDDRPGSRIVV